MIVFLDIDGVMVHANPHRKVELENDGFYKFNDIAVNILKSTLYSTKDEIVLSTSHRFKYDISEWKEIFHRRGLKFKNIHILDVYETSDNINNTYPRVSRKTEIFSYITIRNIKTEDVVIIDDDKSLNDLPSILKERLVLTNPYLGLNDQDEIKAVLKRKIKKKVKGNFLNS